MSEIPQHWRYPPVPEERIKQQAVEFVAKQTGLSETWVERIHDFQWKLAYDSVTEGQTVMLPKLLRFIMSGKPIYKALQKLEEEQKDLILIEQDDIEKLKGELTNGQRVHYTKELEQVQEDLESVNMRIARWQKLMDTKTQKATKRKKK